MKSRKSFLQTYVFSSVGIIGMAVIVIAANFIAAAFNLRRDLTAENLYTLSQGTRDILEDMDTPVTLRFYYSRKAAQMPVYLKSYAQRVEDLLKEYRKAGGDNIELDKKNPSPDSDAEDSANLDGIRGQMGAGGESIYLGLAVSCLDNTVAIPFLAPDRENLLEYDITRAIYRVLHPEKPVLGIMSGLQVMGAPAQQNPMMAMRGGPQGGKPPWQVVTELKRDFDVRDVRKDTESIDADIDVMLLIHPSKLSDKTLFALDQYVLRGGRLIAFLDPMSMIESQENPMSPMMRQMPPGASTLGPLLDAWGVEFETEKVIADLVYMSRVTNRQGRPESMPMVLSLGKDGISADDPATNQLDSLLVVFGGVFTGAGAAGLKLEKLLWTSEDSQLIEKFMAQMPGESVVKQFKPDDRRQTLALRLSGKFKTAFPDGKPKDDDAAGAGADDENVAAAPEDAEQWLQDSTRPGAVVLVGDSDMLNDNFCIRKQSFFGQQIVQPMNDNLNFVFNLVEQLAGDSSLISIRSRGVLSRPFTVVNKKKAEAEQRYKDQIKSLEDEVAEFQRKINDLQREKSKDQRLVISKEQMDAVANFRKKQAKTKQDLKKVRKKFRRDIDSLENRLKWANIALMPFLVSVSGIILAAAKRRRMARK